MNLSKDKQETLKVALIVVFVVFGLTNLSIVISAIKFLFHLFMPFLIGIIIAYVLNVLLNILEQKVFDFVTKRKTRRTLSLILTIAIVLSFLTLLIGLIVPELKDTTMNFVDNLPTYEQNTINSLTKMGLNEDTIKTVKESLNQVVTGAQNLVKDNQDNLLDSAVGIATSVATTIANAVIAIAFAIYLLAQKETLLRQFQKLLKAYLPNNIIKNINQIGTTSNKVFTNFVTGQCLEAVIIGVLCFIGMLILQIPYSPTISVLVGMTALIPVFGAFIGTIIGAILIFMVDPFKALIFIIFIIILQQFEGNLIYPKVVGKSVGLPSIWVLVAVTIGASVGGILGMLLSVPLSSIFYGAISADVNNRLKGHQTKA